MVIENTTPATVTIELATVVSRPRAPAAPAPKSSGHLSTIDGSKATSTAIRTVASATASRTITAGTNQKLDRIFCHQ